VISSEKKAKLIWECRRGMLELDLILSSFVTRCLDKLTDEQITIFERLLTNADPDLYAWFMGYESPVDKELAEIVTHIRFYDNV